MNDLALLLYRELRNRSLLGFTELMNLIIEPYENVKICANENIMGIVK